MISASEKVDFARDHVPHQPHSLTARGELVAAQAHDTIRVD